METPAVTRIRWFAEPETSITAFTGYAGTIDTMLFRIVKPETAGGEHVLATVLPGMGRHRHYGTPDEAKQEAEKWLVGFTASLAASFPGQAPAQAVTCDPAVKVTMTVTLEMTAEQRQAYEDAHGVGFVEIEVLNRLRPDAAEALQGIPWLRRYTTVTLSKPVDVTRDVAGMTGGTGEGV